MDAKSFFLMAFGRQGIRVFRFGEAAPAFTRHLGVPDFPGPEAAALWRAWVTSDNRKTKTLCEFKVALHGAMGSVEYHVAPGDDWWDEPLVTGVGIGPSNCQDRIRRVPVEVVDPGRRIALPKQKRGAGW